ncbi:MAG: RluA family pseudouridine synthase [Bacteroidota bacterium]|nr:RluA family pseudouridine synthase [Bacteroidota bacterium]
MIKFSDLILFEDDDFIVINKPHDVSTLDDRDATKVNILLLAKRYSSDAQVCHRLDKETSGILAIAKNPTAYRHLSMQFENREVLKIYHAVIAGIQKLENRMVEQPILALKDGNVKIDHEKGKEAATIFNTLQIFKGYSLVACCPITGRMHQIRIHLATIGFPIVGDILYGGKYFYLSKIKKGYKINPNDDEQPFIKRVALHAKALTFNKLNGQEITVDAPYPKDFAALIRQLSLHT